MSRHHALSAIGRMNLGVIAMASFYGGVAADFRELMSAPVVPEPTSVVQRNSDLCSAYGYGPSVREKPFAFSDGVAIIPVHGTLINRYSYGWSFLTGYSYIRALMNAALDDDDVKLIVFDINSYGGEAAGCFELAEEIREARSRKSLLAVVDSNACSAAYAIASGCTKIVVTPSGQAGSIGVISMHVSMEKMLDQAGIEITLITAFEHKGDGNPYKKLPDNVRADLAQAVEKRANEFVSLVAKNRNLSEDLVRGTESRTFRADDALQRKLIDAVQPPAKAVSTFLAELGGEDPGEEEDEQMTTKTDQAGGDQPQKPGTPAQPAAAAPAQPAPAASVDQATIDAAVSTALTAERARTSGILGCDEAKGREKLAQTCVDQGMSVETAKVVLAAAPKGDTSEGGKGGNPFRDRMDGDNHPNVGADNEGGEGEGGEGDDAQAKQKHVSSVLSLFGTPDQAKKAS